MQLTVILLTTISALLPSTIANPIAVPVLPDQQEERWLVTDTHRICDHFDTFCSWAFQIRTNIGRYAPVPCAVPVRDDKENRIPASHGHAEDYKCGPYQVSVRWEGMFGAGNGYTTLAIVDHQAKLGIWPAYADWQVEGGKLAMDQEISPRPW
ncbi:hypothetical protein QBC43DRAFT_212311 [Cladorrhinum sp. PSN259]|nr:hypothetical protein QBC43DRAFT_212311 [Cladorrhinum sp. PSN259]